MQARTSVTGLILLASLAPSAWAAEPPARTTAAADPPLKSEYRLTDAEKEAILAGGRELPSAPDIDAAPSATPRPHGEVGFTIGTSGRRGMFGSFSYPLGEEGGAAVSFDYDKWPSVPER